MNSSAKGSTFEREIATQLSLWYSKGENDRVFWRSASSGAMATMRTKQGKKTGGAYGDITAIDPSGAPLTETCVIELKKGYGADFDPLWMVDRLPNTKPTVLESILLKLQQEAKDADRPHHLLIFKRDRREAMIAVPNSFLDSYWYYDSICEQGHKLTDLAPQLTVCTHSLGMQYNFYHLAKFFDTADPSFFSYFAQALKEARARQAAV